MEYGMHFWFVVF